MTAVSKLPATIGTRYLPIRVIGRGGMGVVYEVEHVRTGEHLALKVLSSNAGASAEMLERFKREARAPAQIKSENVVRVSDADVAPELDDAPFLVMELLEGMDLEQVASQSRPDPATVVGWFRQIAPALDKAHRLGIIHRDLKPENLFLANVEDRPPIVKILDFGIAKMAAEGNASTVSGQVLGTPRYMAPEQADHHPRITPATDRYALGLIAYRFLVGESYYRGDVMSILAEILHGELSAPSARNPSVGIAFDAWFLKACHREPEGRFASVSEQVEALAEALGVASVPRDPPLERVATSHEPLEIAETLPAATMSHRFRSANIRRTLAVGGLLLVGGAAALVYRASHTQRIDVSESAKTPATAPVEPSSPPVEVSPAFGSPIARDPPTAAAPEIALGPALGSGGYAAPSAQGSRAAPAIAATSASPSPDKRRPRLPRENPVAPAAAVTDPFKDQK
jgi:serine/threonine-protein kinase